MVYIHIIIHDEYPNAKTCHQQIRQPLVCIERQLTKAKTAKISSCQKWAVVILRAISRSIRARAAAASVMEMEV